MKKLFLLSPLVLFVGCISPATPREAVPANTISLSMTNGTLSVVNPKSNVISNMDITVNSKTGEYHFHADSITDAMDANVITMSGDAYAKSIDAQGDAYDKLLNDAMSGAGTIIGQAAKAAGKP